MDVDAVTSSVPSEAVPSEAVPSAAVPSEADLKEMEKLMSDGKVNLIRKQPHLALESFVELCENLSKWYGQESDKCVEAYLYYGRTLLDIARIENGVLGHAIKELPVFGTETENEETEKEDTEKENTEDEGDGSVAPLNPLDRKELVESAMRDDNLYNPSADEQMEEEEEEEEGGDGDDDAEKAAEDGAKETEDSEVVKEGEEKICSKSEAEAMRTEDVTTETEAKEKPDANASEPASMDVDEGIDVDNDNDDDDDVTNLELAWEMFELVVKICRKQIGEGKCDEKQVKFAIAEAKYDLAQISLEAGRYEDCANDFTECLEIYKQIIEDPNSRVIAEGHYNIALALSFDKKYDDAIKGFETAIERLKARVSELKEQIKPMEEKVEGDITADEKVKLKESKDEILEINDLIMFDLLAKIDDANEGKKLIESTNEQVKDAMKSSLSEFDTGFDKPSEGKEIVHDCTSNIRPAKRRSDEGMGEGNDKKVRNADIVSGEDGKESNAA